MLKVRLRNWLQFLIRQEISEISTVRTELEEHTSSQRWSPTTQIAQRDLIATWRLCRAAGTLPSLSEVGFRVFSQFEEDGILLFIFTLVGARNRVFVDVGGADGINSNAANLTVNHGWTGLHIDGSEEAIERGRQFYAKHPSTWAYPPKFVRSMVTRENINETITNAGFHGEIDLLSIDIDGNDYWVWDALDCISPTVVIIETHIEFGMNNIVVPYDPDYVYPGKHPQYHGASPVAMAELATRKGYRLIGANNYGFNTMYVRNGVGEELLPKVSVDSILSHPRNAERYRLFKEIEDWEYIGPRDERRDTR